MRGRDTEVMKSALASCRTGFAAVALFSAVVNILMLTGSIYMLQVYDRVLPSRSIPTLVSLSLIAAALYILLGAFDWLRTRLLARIGIALDRALSAPAVLAILRLSPQAQPGTQLMRDLDSVRTFLSGPGPTTFFDLPWIPLYGGLCFLLHPLLGWTLVAGAVVLALLALLTEMLTRRPSAESARIGARRMAMLETARRNSELIAALGMERRVLAGFAGLNDRYIGHGLAAAEIGSGLGALSRVVRFMLQSALIGIGALLVVNDQATAGVTIAASILGSRALAPVELAIAHWRPFIAARQAWGRLGEALGVPAHHPAVAPEPPARTLALKQVFACAPGGTLPVLRDVSLALKAGDGLAVIGPSASGKSTLARVITGVWPTARGELRLDGATLDQWSAEQRGSAIGYLPQDVQLFDGSIAENIARMDPEMTEAAVIAAAKAAGAYEMILSLPQGFETPIGEAGGHLSGGQRQRIALARALYRDPFLVVLDEPNANLDAEGDSALAQAVNGVRKRGGIVIVIAHRPSALVGIDLVMVLSAGAVQALGPKEEVLRMSLAPRAAPLASPPGRAQVAASRP